MRRLKGYQITLFLVIGGMLGALAVTQFGTLPQSQAFINNSTAPAAEETTPPAKPLNFNDDLIRDLNNAFTTIAENAQASVVTILTDRVVKNQFRNPFGNGSPFERFFGDMFPAPDTEQHLRGQGSGVIVSRDGYILTNNHVVDKADKIQVRLFNGKKVDAKIVGTDRRTDLAVVKVESDGLKPIKLGDSDKLKVGEWVLAIGSPLRENLAHSVSSGIVSAKSRSLQLASVEDFIQTDAAINPGNSGGALVNLYGELVGINTAIVSQSGGFQGIGFAIPINIARWVMDGLIKDGKVTYGYLGITPQPVDENIAKALDLDDISGALVAEVHEDTPAEKAGLKAEDVIIALDGEKIRDDVHLRAVVGTKKPGTKITLTVVRDGKKKDINVTLGEFPEPEELASMSGQKENIKLGFAVSTLNDQLAARFDLDPSESGVVITDIDRGSVAFQQGLRVGDLITAVNRKKVKNTSDFRKIVSKLSKGDAAFFRVMRGSRTFFVAFELE